MSDVDFIDKLKRLELPLNPEFGVLLWKCAWCEEWTEPDFLELNNNDGALEIVCIDCMDVAIGEAGRGY